MITDKLSKTYWAKQREEELAYLAGLTGMTQDEVERDLSELDVHARGEGVTFGLAEDVSPMALVPACIDEGQRVNAFVLMRVAQDYGLAAAKALDDALYPCPICGLSFYSSDGFGICEQCDLREGEAAGLVTIHEHAVAFELAGAYTPRCDY